MLRMLAPRTLWEELCPSEALILPVDLEYADRVLDDRGLLLPFVPFFSLLHGRPSIPMETFVRLMFLKYRLDLGYETLFAEVSGSFTYKYFCRIGVFEPVPSPSTLSKLVRRVGEATVKELNRALLRRADEHELVDMRKMRVDSTVVPADIAYPTDSGLLAKGISSVLTSVEQVRRAGVATGVAVDDCREEVRRRTMQIGKSARRRGHTSDEVLVGVDELADLAETAAEQGAQVLAAAAEALAAGQRGHRLAAVAGRLAQRLDGLSGLVAQCRAVAREMPPPASQRRVSMHDKDARPITKSTSARKLWFGYTGQIVDNADGLITDYDVAVHYPP